MTTTTPCPICRAPVEVYVNRVEYRSTQSAGMCWEVEADECDTCGHDFTAQDEADIANRAETEAREGVEP